MSGSVLDLEYHEFLEQVRSYPTEVLAGLAEAMEDRLRGVEAAISAARKREEKETEVKLLMVYAWNTRKLSALKALMAERGGNESGKAEGGAIGGKRKAFSE